MSIVRRIPTRSGLRRQLALSAAAIVVLVKTCLASAAGEAPAPPAANGKIPRMVILAKRMTPEQKAAYDSATRLQLAQAASKPEGKRP
ncbi:hypothetical protein [Noviherbaspirillum galbum]|uniref:Uncharacterized protein n=1 Tax=Noviherbaspirillum galbum TaxID=2709383 RepID=A0A6B3SLQ2_9BURK|nr:hypothetical protein [Noviherbaspirillum galbum]NEX61710.1 hypothetical protein [Noviherbaspirillum galbum]